MKKTERLFTPIASIKDLVDHIGARGEHTVFEYPQGKEYVSLSYAAFHDMILGAAAGLCAAGLAGERVALIGESSPEWVAAYLAVIATGGVIIPMDKDLAVEEIEGFLTGVEARAVFHSASFTEKFAHARAEHPTLRLFIPFSGEADDKVLPFPALLEGGKALPEGSFSLPDRDPEKMAIMLFTSGTTGTSKCVMLSEKNLVSSVNAACASVNFSPDDKTVSVLPLHHTYELTIMLASLTYGFTIGINDSLRHLMRNFAHFQPTGLILVPLFVSTMYKKIWDEARKKKKDKLLRAMLPISGGLRRIGIDLRRKLYKDVIGAFGGRLTKIICGGAPLNPELVRNFDALGIQISEGYGITECSPLIAVSPYFAPRAGSVGPAVPCCETRIAVEGQNEKGFDEGEIQVRGDNVMLGYYQNDAANAAAFTEDGWFRTGDIGYMDKDGYIYITGRMKSVIVLENGKNVFPEEIEEYLAKIPEIGESVVVGRKIPDGDTVNLIAVIYPSPEVFPAGTPAEEIEAKLREKITALNRKLPSFKKITDIEIRETEFEKTTSRKIKRHLVH